MPITIDLNAPFSISTAASQQRDALAASIADFNTANAPESSDTLNQEITLRNQIADLLATFAAERPASGGSPGGYDVDGLANANRHATAHCRERLHVIERNAATE